VTDTDQQLTAARHIGAFKKAIDSLRKYYEEVLPKLNVDVSQQGRHMYIPPPYKTEYKSLRDGSDSTLHFTYQDKLARKLVFLATLTDGDKVVVKFVRRYSQEAHEECMKLGHAPTLRGIECLPGGWTMVVMDYLDPDQYHTFDDNSGASRRLYQSMKGALEDLHRAQFVHGDVRAVNTMVKNDKSSGFMLVDFDWAGTVKTVCYPPNVNRSAELKRPADAIDGNLILEQHDMWMLDAMFSEEVVGGSV
jgi:hypothetical protein